MARQLKDEIERLLDDSDESAAPLVRARLRASLSEALAADGAAGWDASPDQLARAAAFLDGRLDGPERDRFLAELARDPGHAADIAAMADLLADAGADSPPMPVELSAKAADMLRQTPSPAPAASGSAWRERLSLLWPQRQVVWAAAALVAVAVLTPTAFLMLNDKSEMTSSPQPDTDDEACDPARARESQPPNDAKRPAADDGKPDSTARPSCPPKAPDGSPAGTTPPTAR